MSSWLHTLWEVELEIVNIATLLSENSLYGIN